GYDIKDLMFTIFSADWFYESKNIGVKIKSPVVLLAGVMRCLHVRFDGIQAVIFIERALGQVLFNPPNVAGWLGGKNWIDNSTLMLRLNFVTYLFQAGEVKFKVKEAFEAKKRNKAFRKIQASVDLNPLIGLYTKKNEAQIFDTLSNFLVQAPIRLDLNDINTFLKRNNKEDFIKTLALRLMSLPEYQVC
ncbi:MAG: hypothetical protein ACI81W_003806, partial [Saprospiraceae bacterium]